MGKMDGWMDWIGGSGNGNYGGETCSPFRRKWTHKMISDQKFETHAHRARTYTHTVYYYTLSIIQAQLIMNEHRNVPASEQSRMRVREKYCSSA